jgi:hypothetical protein
MLRVACAELDAEEAEKAELMRTAEAQVPESIPPDAFDLPISDMFANAKLLANVRTSDAVGELKAKLAALTGTEADALRLVLVDDSSDTPKQIDLEIETRTLDEYGVGRGSNLMWQAQDAADAKQRRDDREAERLRVAKAEHEAEIRQAGRWAFPTLLGGAVSQAGWWSLYGDLGLWGGVIGVPLTIVGLLRFCCVVGHSPGFDREDDSGVICIVMLYAMSGLVATVKTCPVLGTVPSKRLDDDGRVVTEWVIPEAAQLAGQELTLTAAPNCTDGCPRWWSCTCKREIADDDGHFVRLNLTNDGYCNDGGLGSDDTYCPLGSDTADCGCRSGTTVADWLPPQELGREYGWGDRYEHGGCNITLIAAGCSLLFLLIAVEYGREELAAMRRVNHVRRTSDGRTGVASRPFRSTTRTDDEGWTVAIDPEDQIRQIKIRWNDDGTWSYEAAEDFETLSFEAHVAARFDAP